jgi:hypothetical protein
MAVKGKVKYGVRYEYNVGSGTVRLNNVICFMVRH